MYEMGSLEAIPGCLFFFTKLCYTKNAMLKYKHT